MKCCPIGDGNECSFSDDTGPVIRNDPCFLKVKACFICIPQGMMSVKLDLTLKCLWQGSNHSNKILCCLFNSHWLHDLSTGVSAVFLLTLPGQSISCCTLQLLFSSQTNKYVFFVVSLGQRSVPADMGVVLVH